MHFKYYSSTNHGAEPFTNSIGQSIYRHVWGALNFKIYPVVINVILSTANDFLLGSPAAYIAIDSLLHNYFSADQRWDLMYIFTKINFRGSFVLSLM